MSLPKASPDGWFKFLVTIFSLNFNEQLKIDPMQYINSNLFVHMLQSTTRWHHSQSSLGQNM
jgi:hypothetical protein